MRIFMTKRFDKFALDEGIEIDSLIKLVQNIETGGNPGQWSDLGGGVFKARVARKGEGSSGGYRVITLLRRGDKCFFVRGFAKKDLSNIDQKEVQLFKVQALEWLRWQGRELNIQLTTRKIKEIKNV